MLEKGARREVRRWIGYIGHKVENNTRREWLQPAETGAEETGIPYTRIVLGEDFRGKDKVGD
jgi:hypothetical protein